MALGTRPARSRSRRCAARASSTCGASCCATSSAMGPLAIPSDIARRGPSRGGRGSRRPGRRRGCRAARAAVGRAERRAARALVRVVDPRCRRRRHARAAHARRATEHARSSSSTCVDAPASRRARPARRAASTACAPRPASVSSRNACSTSSSGAMSPTAGPNERRALVRRQQLVEAPHGVDEVQVHLERTASSRLAFSCAVVLAPRSTPVARVHGEVRVTQQTLRAVLCAPRRTGAIAQRLLPSATTPTAAIGGRRRGATPMGRDRFGDRSAPLAWVACRQWAARPRRPESSDAPLPRPPRRPRAASSSSSSSSSASITCSRRAPRRCPRARPATAGAVPYVEAFRQSHDLLYPGQRPVRGAAAAPKSARADERPRGPAVPWLRVSVRAGGYCAHARVGRRGQATPRVRRVGDARAAPASSSAAQESRSARAVARRPGRGRLVALAAQRLPALLFAAGGRPRLRALAAATKALPEPPSRRRGSRGSPTRARMRGHGHRATAHAFSGTRACRTCRPSCSGSNTTTARAVARCVTGTARRSSTRRAAAKVTSQRSRARPQGAQAHRGGAERESREVAPELASPHLSRTRVFVPCVLRSATRARRPVARLFRGTTPSAPPTSASLHTRACRARQSTTSWPLQTCPFAADAFGHADAFARHAPSRHRAPRAFQAYTLMIAIRWCKEKLQVHLGEARSVPPGAPHFSSRRAISRERSTPNGATAATLVPARFWPRWGLLRLKDGKVRHARPLATRLRVGYTGLKDGRGGLRTKPIAFTATSSS